MMKGRTEEEIKARINSYIVGCKCIPLYYWASGFVPINSYIVGCK